MKMWRVKARVRKVLHLREPWKSKRQKSNRFPVGTIRWLLFDRWIPVRWSGLGGLPEGKADGDLAYYTLSSWSHALAVTFPKAHRWEHKLTVKKFRNRDCSHRIWRRKVYGMISSCETHGFRALFED